MNALADQGAGRRFAPFLRVLRFREVTILAVILLVGTAMSCWSGQFLDRGNLLSILLGVSTESIVAVGMTVLLISGGFDLSVGSTAAFSGAIAALCLVHDCPPVLAVLAGLGTGAGIGLANGLVIAGIGINPFIATLAMMSIVRGGLLVVTGGRNISGLPKGFTWLGQAGVIGVQCPILIAAVVVVLFDVLLRKHRFFRLNYYLGGNERAAVLSGIPVRQLKLFNYVLSGFLAAVAGVVMTARFAAATTTAGTGMELRVITAAIVGGASLQGGEGSVLGAFFGALLMALIVSSLTLLGVDVYWQQLVIGATLLAAVMIDLFSKRRLRP